MASGRSEILPSFAVPNRLAIAFGFAASWVAFCSPPTSATIPPALAEQCPELEGQCQVTPVWKLDPNTQSPINREDSQTDADEDREFQPTTKLNGEVVFAIISPAGETPNQDATRLSLGNRVRLNIETSFSGKDQLRLRLQTVNLAELDQVFETDLARLSIQGDDDNEFDLSRLDYRFPLGDRTTVTIPVVGGSISDIADSLNPLLDSSGSGSITRFGQRNPLYRQGGGAGVGISHDLSDQFNLSVGYLSNAENLLPDEETVAFAQLTVQPQDTVSLGILYAYALNGLDTGTGTQLANAPFDDQSDALTSHSIGLQASANLTTELTLSGWAGWTRAIATDLPNTPEVDILNWAITLGYLDLGGEGNLAAIVIGNPPEVLGSRPPLHVELSYKIQTNEHFSITPGFTLVDQPDSQVTPIFNGIIRATFKF